ncbi:MAG: methyltransferase domain-containing protein [Thermodesulfobacteriota bacterium]|nr:methyltransferase domain-containing protein [Thermodesulfobacteriota bacterium]
MITIDFNFLNIKPGYQILDMGCGEGRHTASAQEQEKVFCVGADMDHNTLLTAREKIKLHKAFITGRGSKWSLATADITNLAFKTDGFDVVICSEVMEHIHEQEKALSELTRVLKPTGTLAITVPRFWPEKICWLLSDDYCNANQGHVRIYEKSEIISKVEQKGLRFIKSHYAHSLHSPFWWLKCLVGPDRTDSFAVNLYHRFLVWDLMKKPFITKFLEKLLNPLMGKSLVLYFKFLYPESHT